MPQCVSRLGSLVRTGARAGLWLLAAGVAACAPELDPEAETNGPTFAGGHRETAGPVGDLARYELVRAVAEPVQGLQAGPAKLFPREVHYEIVGGARHLRLELRKNVELFAAEYDELQQNEAGELVSVSRTTGEGYLNCYYQGVAYVDGGSEPQGAVAASLCKGLNAVVRAEGGLLRLAPAGEYPPRAAGEETILFVDPSGSVESGFDRILPAYDSRLRTAWLVEWLARRNALGSATVAARNIAAPDTLWLELAVVSDHRRFLQFGDVWATTQAAAEVVNGVDAIYGTNDLDPPLRIRIVRQVVFNVADPYEVEADEAGNLAHDFPLRDAFAAWARTDLQDNDARHLITGYDPPSAGGVSYRFGICDPLRAAGYSFARTASGHNDELAFTMAHELAHTVGIGHDGRSPRVPPNHNYADSYIDFLDTSSCPRYGALMSARPTALGDTVVSDCSKRQYNVLVTLGRPQPYGGYDPRPSCLDNGPEPTCADQPGAECSPSEVCCDENCHFVPASAARVCRNSVDPHCDVEEICDGLSAECPPDLGQNASEMCVDEFDGPGACYDARCQSFALACAEKRPRHTWDSMLLIPCTVPGQEPTCSELTCEYSIYPGRCLQKGQAPDGVLCGDERQCFAGECVPSSELAPDEEDDCGAGDGSGGPSQGEPCDGPDADLCSEGVMECDGGVPYCTDTTGDSLDACNGLDDDCNPATADGSGEPAYGEACDGPDSDL